MDIVLASAFVILIVGGVVSYSIATASGRPAETRRRRPF